MAEEEPIPGEPLAEPAAPPAIDSLADWFARIADACRERRAIETALLLAEERAWIHRRTERIKFVASSRICREMDVEFTVPDMQPLHGNPSWRGAPHVLPIALPAKRPLKDLHVRDESGRPLSVLTREENGDLAARLLDDQAEQVFAELRERGIPIELSETESAGLKSLFRDVVGARRGDNDWPTSGERTDRSKKAIDTFRHVATPVADPTRLSVENKCFYYLWQNDTINGLLRQLHERFVLFVVLDGLSVGDRRIIAISYEEEVDIELGWFSADQGKLRQRWRSARQRLGQGLGWKFLTIRVRTRAIFGAGSYHVEFEVPDEIVIKQAELGMRLEVIDRSARQRSITRRVLRREGQSERAHLYESGISPSPRGTHDPIRVAASEVGYAEFGLALKPASLLPPLLIGLTTFVVLCSGLIVHRTKHTAATEASAVLLVVLPGLFAAYLLPGEHRLVRKMYRQLRFLVLGQAVISFAAAGVFVVNFSASWKYAAWRDLAIISAIGVAVVGVAVIRSWRRVPESWADDLPAETTQRTALSDVEEV